MNRPYDKPGSVIPVQGRFANRPCAPGTWNPKPGSCLQYLSPTSFFFSSPMAQVGFRDLGQMVQLKIVWQRHRP